MKTKLFLVTVLVFALALLSVWAVGAQGPQPPQPGPQTEPPGPPLGPQWEGKPLSGEPASLARPAGEGPGVRAAAIPLGQPGTVFRYVQRFGVTEEGYIEDTNHFYDPGGVATDGTNIWIADSWGNRVVKFNSAGNFLQQIGKASFRGATGTSLDYITDVAVDGSGNIWVVDGGAGHVVKFNAAGQRVSELGQAWNRGTGNDRFNDPIGIAFDSAGNIYVSDSGLWGEYGNHRVQVFDSAGNYLATIGVTGVPGSDNSHFRSPRRIAVYAGANRLYVADAGNHRVQIFDITTPAAPTYVATLGVSGEAGSDNSHFDYPEGVAVDANYIYVADSDNNRVQIFDRTTYAYVATIGGSYGQGDYQFNHPSDVAVDASGNIYVADAGNKRVQQFNSSRIYQRTYGTTGVSYVTDGYHYNYPSGVAVAADGSIYISEHHGHRLVKLNATGEPQWTIGQPGQNGTDNNHLFFPNGVTLDSAGRVYVADTVNNRVQIFNSNGTYYATLGTGEGTGDYQFDHPNGVAVDRNGNIYVADRYNHRIQVYNASRTYIGTIGTTGVAGSDNSHFNEPHDVAVDSAGNIYVADLNNHRVQVFNSSRVYVRTIGETGVPGDDFGHLSNPIGIAVDAAGRIYVADGWGGRVQVFDSSGAYLTTIGGSRGNRTGQMRQADGLAVDSAGNLYIAEYLNHRIQKFAPGVPGWRQVNINGFGEQRNQWISSLITFKGNLYATGYQPYVWRLAADGTWSAVSTLGFGDSTNSEIDAMAVFSNHLYAATFTFVCDDPDCNTWHTNGPQFWRTADGTTWENVTPPGSIGSDFRWVPVMVSLGGYLYATLDRGDQNTLGAEIWRTADGQTWQQVASGGFGDPYNTGVLSLVEYNGYLYAGTRHGDWQDDAHPNGPLGGEVWRYNGTNWVRVNDPGFGDVEAHRVERLIAFNNALYAYISRVGGTSKGAEVWRCTATVCNSQSDWVKVADNGFGNPQNQYIFSGIAFGDRLYAAVANYSVGVQLWRTADGTSWEPAALDAGLGDSNNSYVWLGAMAVHNNRLYLGTTNRANGGEVWLFLHNRVYLPLVLRNYTH